MEKGRRMESALREVVCRRQTQHFGKLLGSTSNRTASEQGGNYLGGRTGRQTHAHVPATAPRSLPVRECAQTEQNQKGRSGHYLSAEYSRGRDRHAGVCAYRRRPFSNLRRI